MSVQADTIAAIATPPGRGGVGIIRISGSNSFQIARHLAGFDPSPRHAHFSVFQDGNIKLDEGLLLFFPGPNSFTGEDVIELHGHGGPVLLDSMLQVVLKQGARLARPGEFTERAFLNDKIDLLQAEAIADLIDASSIQAARSALASLQGHFSKRIDDLVTGLLELRLYVEASIDFPEEEVDFLGDGKVLAALDTLHTQVEAIRQSATQGQILREGLTVVLAGRPNAGKSSLLNALCGHERAIVTDIAGTTRDTLTESLNLDGLPLNIIDTAGLRVSDDPVEKIGIQRAQDAVVKADRVLLLVDASETSADLSKEELWESLGTGLSCPDQLTLVRNKIDITQEPPGFSSLDGIPVSSISARSGSGVEALKRHLKEAVGYEATAEGVFMARRRHLEALDHCVQYLEQARRQLVANLAGELVAEELRQAQSALEIITGRYTPDDLLGDIFSRFCIGK